MGKRNQKYMRDLIIATLVLLWASGMTYADSLSMTEFKAQFQQQTGMTWEEATADDRRDFLGVVREHSEQGKTGLEKVQQKILSDALLDKKEKTPYHVRKNYEKKTGKKWDDASEEEQDRFAKEYEISEKEIKQEEEMRLKEEEMRVKDYQREKEAKEREAALKANLKKQEEAMALQEKRRKRQDEAQKLRDAQRDKNEMLRAMKEKFGRR